MSKRPKENELDVNDLLNLPSIQALLDEDKEEKPVHKVRPVPMPTPTDVKTESVTTIKELKEQPNTADDVTSASETTPIHVTPEVNVMSSSEWERFLMCANRYDHTSTNKENTNYRIKKDIVLALSSVNIEDLSVTKLINCILRTFIEEHSKELKKMRRKRGRSILDSD